MTPLGETSTWASPVAPGRAENTIEGRRGSRSLYPEGIHRCNVLDEPNAQTTPAPRTFVLLSLLSLLIGLYPAGFGLYRTALTQHPWAHGRLVFDICLSVACLI